MDGMTYQHWQIKKDEHGIAWIGLDRKDASTNTLNTEVLEEFDRLLDYIKQAERPKGVVIYSEKKSGFIAGADIKQFKHLESAEEATNMIRQGQLVFDKLEALPMPTLALINGFCLGGGLELALACDYRIAIEHDKTKLGLPEVMLGIHPGWGGTIRLPKIIGAMKAMDLILTGRIVNAKSAKKLGFVDAALPDRYAKQAAVDYILNQPKKKSLSKIDKLIHFEFCRRIIGIFLKKKIAKKVKPEHYPAPFQVVKNWVDYNVNDPDAMVMEARSIGKLMVGKTAENLVRVFFLREKLKGLAKGNTFKAQHIHVVGAGVMGGDIAIWCALRGLKVTLQDTNLDAIASTFKRAEQLFSKKLKLPHLVQAAKDRMTADKLGEGVKIADVIIEAIVEKEEAKKSLFFELEKKAKSTAILATNTSTIVLDKIRAQMERPERLVGIHFFNPVAQMPLVEIVYDKTTDKEVKDKATYFVSKIDKLPLPVKSESGFLVNRVLIPYLSESINLIEEGIPAEVIDRAALEFGMPMGPIELTDTVGLDVCRAAAEGLGLELPKMIHDMIKENRLGKKTNRGFYRYKNGKPIKDKSENYGDIPKDTQDRLIMRMINEAVACLREGIVEDEEMLDAGMIFGTGFAPFRGGPMQYIKDIKKEVMKTRLGELEERYGERFHADQGWVC